jgi:spore coat protein A
MNFKTFKKGVVLGVAILAIFALSVPSAFAQPVPGGTLDPLTIPKYQDPLVIPPVLYDDGGSPMDVEVALREITQQVLPAGFPATRLWAYGNPDNAATFNNPAFTIEVTTGVTTNVRWRNELVDGSNDFRTHLFEVDQTLHWANPPGDCRDAALLRDCRGDTAAPYRGPVPMVTHVHGAHVGPESDGYPEAWWLPNASNIDCIELDTDDTAEAIDDYYCFGTLANGYNGANTFKGYADYSYPNTQPTTTLWYHDHALGITRLNVYAAAAGFWLIRTGGDGETGLESGTLPGPAVQVNQDPNGNAAVRSAIREIPIAIQGKSFNTDGSQFYPKNRAFFEGLSDGQVFDSNAIFGLNIPFLPDPASDISPVWNPEFFANTMVVNGKTWPMLEVAPERYRFRLLNATDSRFLNLALFEVGKSGQIKAGKELPFFQIGAEQSLLPQVVMIQTGYATPLVSGDPLPKNKSQMTPGTFPQQALLFGPAERPDVIVDFSGLKDGTVIRMINTAPDAPFGGFPDVPADPATTGQVMQFVVNSALATAGGDPSSPPNMLTLNANPGGDPLFTTNDNTRDLALLEEVSALICIEVLPNGTIQQVGGVLPPACGGIAVPFAPKAAVLGTNGSGGGTAQMWSDPIRQNMGVDDIETWELWNWSADAHPIHLHLVKFKVLGRQVIGGAQRGPEPWEAGWKDTVAAYPGEVTTLQAQFDLAGLYVWHCHILSHEDNEMMVPYCVDNAGGTPGPGCAVADPTL